MAAIIYNWANAWDVVDYWEDFENSLYEFYTSQLGEDALSQEVWENYLNAGCISGQSSDENVRLMPDRGTVITFAQIDEEIIGYTVFWKGHRVVRKDSNDRKKLAILLQCVVKEEYREKHILKKLLTPVWGTTNEDIWGSIVHDSWVLEMMSVITMREPILTNSQYLESDIAKRIIRNLLKKEGENKTIKFVHSNSQLIRLNSEEEKNFWIESEKENQEAYANMNMGGGNQEWEKSTEGEIRFLSTHLGLSDTASKEYLVYDIGCGAGRHSLELAYTYTLDETKRKTITGKRVKQVIGIDYVQSNVDIANKSASELVEKGIVTFEWGDATNYIASHPERANTGDIVLCLFDVICTFEDDNLNKAIIRTVYDLCKPGGKAVFTAMNYDKVARKNYTVYRHGDTWSQLFGLQISNLMGTSGDVHDPTYCLLDEQKHICYRRERFYEANGYPFVANVLDRRYTRDELVRFCKEAGFEVEMTSCRNAGFAKEMVCGKEHIVICRKS